MTEPPKVKTEEAVKYFGEIRADRACIGCGFNLFAQPVSKEEHYGLAICRCPECGVVTALQSYPTMTHWTNRFRALIAAVWIVVLLGAFVANWMSFMGMVKGASYLAGQKMTDIIGQENDHWLAIQAQNQALIQTNATPAANAPLPAGTTIITDATGTTITTPAIIATPQVITPGQYKWTWLAKGWTETHLDQTIDDSGGLLKNIDRSFLATLIPGTVVAFIFGVFWSVALLGATKRKALIVPLVASIAAVLLLFGVSIPDLSFTMASRLAQDLYAPIIGPGYIAILCLASLVGVWIGRKIARTIIILALPPRSRVPLSILWTRDGLELPRP